jgi:type IV pilus assembly protein PilM
MVTMGFFGSNDITGIDVGSGSIKVVRIERGRKRPTVLSADIVDFPLESRKDDVGTILRHLLANKKIGNTRVMTQMPGKDITIRSFSLPKMPLAELTEAVRWEAKRHISYPVDTAQVEYLLVGEKQEGTVVKYDIVMVAAERGKVAEHLAPLKEANIKLTAVDANALALRNVFHLLEKPADVNTVVVDIGAGKTEIDIFKGGVLRFSRCLETGGLDMTRAVSVAMGIGLQEAEQVKRTLNVLASPETDQAVAMIRTVLDGLLMEIRRSMDYYKTTCREQVVDSTLLTGGVSLMPGIKEYFVQSLDGAVELDQPFEGLSVRKKIYDEYGPMSPRFATAVGLALRKV